MRSFALYISFLFLIIVQKAFSQDLSLPSFHTTDPQKLSEHITKGIKNDSDKVAAIHYWITHNIKYDVKKWLNFNYDPVPLEKVLKQHKANCLGYSQLFNELCNYAGIKAVEVKGYIKDNNVDLVDNFYLDEHSWNAVLLNGKWKYVDDCWDAGYIKYSKVAFFGHIVKFVTSGRVIIVKYKPHFIKDPGDYYFLKNDSYYKRDHLALNPLWQLAVPNITLKQFKADSTYYFGLEPSPKDGRKYDYTSDNEKSAYCLSDDSYKTISDGWNGNKFNFRNHYCLAKSFFAAAGNEFAKIGSGSSNKAMQKDLCDTVIYCTNKAMDEYDTNAVYLHKQKSELLSHNIIKRNTLISNNNKLIRSTKFVLRNLDNGIALSGKNIKTARKMLKAYREKYKKLRKSRSFYKKRSAKTAMMTDSLNYYYDAFFYGDSLSIQHDSMKKYFSLQDAVYKNITKNSSAYSTGSARFSSIEDMLILVRYEYFDDYDYEVRMLKDTVLSKKFDNDLLLFSDSIFMIKLLYFDLKLLKSKIYAQSRFYKLRANSLTRLKGACVNEGSLAEEYENNLKAMRADVDSLSDIMKVWIERYADLRHFCRKQKAMTKKELNAYLREKSTEYGFYGVRSRYIKHHYAALISNNKFHLRQTSDLKRKAERLKKNIEKKF